MGVALMMLLWANMYFNMLNVGSADTFKKYAILYLYFLVFAISFKILCGLVIDENIDEEAKNNIFTP